MIIGMGSDLTNMERIANSLERWGDKFTARCFTDAERAKAAQRPFTAVGTYAKRWAAKEAFAKAVGTGFKRGVFHKDIGVVNLPSGAPTLALANGAAKRLAELTPPGHEAHVHLTLTDDHPWAQAFVVIEARPI
jgi:holo-[acyl-carrier protein] synthase